ncbi:MAG: radical SAM protein [Candidatus Omnitrophica bacterium]|nr:radical SAM protein [Candidatus Omnitrophota bacterium]
MFCSIQQRKFADLCNELDSVAIKEKIPYMCAFELTYRCNLSCCHCYCNLPANHPNKEKEIPTNKVRQLLDEMVDSGCLWLLLTGGEVFLREDFWQIYLYALRKGFLIDLFTNATLLDEEKVKRLSDYPPLSLEISLYAAKEQIHDNITGVCGSFKRLMNAITALKKYNVPFSLKSILMKENIAELTAMRKLAKDYQVSFRYDTLICPRLDGGNLPLIHRLSEWEMAQLDILDDYPILEKIFQEYWAKPMSEPLICGAGVFAFNINPYAVLSPCTMFKSFQYSLHNVSFLEAWKKMTGEFEKKIKYLLEPLCQKCNMVYICPNCPAWSELETGSLKGIVRHICLYAKTLEKIYRITKEGNNGEKALSKTNNAGG